MLGTDTWISLLGSLAIVAVGYGAIRAKVAAQGELLRELREIVNSSNQRQGERLGALERWQEAVREVEKDRRRRPTGTVPVPERED